MSELNAPESLEQTAKKAYQEESYEEAAKTFQAAQAGYLAREEHLKAAEMANNASVALLQAGDAQGALNAVGNTAEVFAQAGDVRRQALALGNQAAALAGLNRLDEALALYRQSADLLKQIGETELRATVLQAISRLQMRSGQYLEAVASMQSGLDALPRPSARQRLVKKLLDLPFKLMGSSGKKG